MEGALSMGDAGCMSNRVYVYAGIPRNGAGGMSMQGMPRASARCMSYRVYVYGRCKVYAFGL